MTPKELQEQLKILADEARNLEKVVYIDKFRDKYIDMMGWVESMVNDAKGYMDDNKEFSAMAVEAEAVYRERKMLFDMLKELLEEDELDVEEEEDE